MAAGSVVTALGVLQFAGARVRPRLLLRFLPARRARGRMLDPRPAPDIGPELVSPAGRAGDRRHAHGGAVGRRWRAARRRRHGRPPSPSAASAPGPLTVDELTASGLLPAAVADEAAAMVRRERNLPISGGTGSDKTTSLNALVSLLPAGGRVISIEDTLETVTSRRSTWPPRHWTSCGTEPPR